MELGSLTPSIVDICANTIVQEFSKRHGRGWFCLIRRNDNV